MATAMRVSSIPTTLVAVTALVAACNQRDDGGAGLRRAGLASPEDVVRAAAAAMAHGDHALHELAPDAATLADALDCPEGNAARIAADGAAKLDNAGATWASADVAVAPVPPCRQRTSQHAGDYLEKCRVKTDYDAALCTIGLQYAGTGAELDGHAIAIQLGGRWFLEAFPRRPASP